MTSTTKPRSGRGGRTSHPSRGRASASTKLVSKGDELEDARLERERQKERDRKAVPARKPKGATAAEVRAAQAARLAAKPERRRAEGPRPGSTLAGAIAVLKAKGKPMNCTDIYAEIVKRKLCPTLGGKTPVATIQAQLALANKRGEHVCRPEPGVYALRSEA
jgi:hypothetical protein